MSKEKQKNVFGETLQICCYNPMTGYFRDGLCRTISEDKGTHTVCAKMDKEFLENIVLNGIAGVDGICDMIKDCIDSGDLQGAKDWIDQLNEEIYEGSE